MDIVVIMMESFFSVVAYKAQTRRDAVLSGLKHKFGGT